MPLQSTIFYAWQSDLPNKTNRSLIESALRRACKSLHKAGVCDEEHIIDRDTQGLPGSPDIAASIYKKIDSASIFVGDVSIISGSSQGRKCPNPNVLIELGYALKSLGDDSVILVLNEAYGSISDLPFDLRGKRVSIYRCTDQEEPAAARDALARTFEEALAEVARHQKLGAVYQRNSEFATALVSSLIRVQLFGNEVDRRPVNPWLDEIADRYTDPSHWLRDNSHMAAAAELDVAESMEALADLLDEVRGHHHTLGGGAEFEAKVLAATQAAAALQARLFQAGPLTAEARSEIVTLLLNLQGRLAGWIGRARGRDLYHTNLYSDFLAAITEIGYQLAQLSYYPLEEFSGDATSELRRIGEILHLLDLEDELSLQGERETMVEMVGDCEKQLRDLLQRVGLLQTQPTE